MKAKVTLFCLILISFLSSTVNGQEHYVVSAASVIVRKAASAESANLGTLKRGDDVYVHSFKGSWAEIKYEGKRAFVPAKHIEPKASRISESTPPATTKTDKNTKTNNNTKANLSESQPAKQQTTSYDNNGSNDNYMPTGGIMMTLGGENYFSSSKNWSSIFSLAFEGGRFIPSTPVFYDLGLGFYITKTNIDTYSYSMKATGWGLQVPAYFGYLIGQPDRLALILKAGIKSNFLISSRMNSHSVDVDFGDRFSFAGGFKATLSYSFFGLSAEYVIPFQSSGKGYFAFGLSLGI